MLMFRREDRERVARGEITVTFRLWRSAQVKAGKTYQSGFGAIEVDDVRVIPAAMISDDDVGPSGCADIAAIRELAGEHHKVIVAPDTLLHRVQFHFLGDGALPIAPPQALDAERVVARLERMDRSSLRGAWTLATLQLIERQPHVPARLLAAELGYEKLDFKANVRKLKALGLTISHEIGYELSDVGRKYLASVRPPSRRASAGGVRRSPRTPGRSRS